MEAHDEARAALLLVGVALCVGFSTPSVSFMWGKLGVVSRIALGSTMRH